MQNLLTWSYWFSLQARELMPTVKLALAAAFAALVVIGVLAHVLSKKRAGNMFWAEGGKRVASMGLWMGIAGLLLVWFTHELVYFFGARFWYLVWLAVAVIWTGAIIRFLIAVVPKKKAAYEEKARIAKWIPKRS
jgi:MFS family permease